MVLRKSQEGFNLFITEKRTVTLLLIALMKQLDSLTHDNDAVAQHDKSFVLLLADQTVILLIQIIAIVLDIVKGIAFVPVVVLRSHVTFQLSPVLLFVLISHLFQLLFS